MSTYFYKRKFRNKYMEKDKNLEKNEKLEKTIFDSVFVCGIGS